MLTSVNWQQYLLAITTLGIVYYAIILFCYYRVELVAIFHLNSSKQTTPEPSHLNQHSILGEINQESTSSLLLSEDLRFSEANEENEENEN